MKKTIILAALATLASCTKMSFDEDATESKKVTRNIQFVVKNISVDYGETRATLASESITDLWVCEGTTLLCHQTSSDSDFGTPTIALTVGAHDLTFIASKADGQAFSDHWTCTKVKDTYGSVLAYTVSSSSTSKQVQLTRVNGKVMWTVEDEIPSNAATMTLTVGQCLGLDAELNGVDAGEYTTSFSLASYIGRTGLTASVNVLAADYDEGSDTEAAFRIEDEASATICQYQNTVTVVPNQVCNIHGSFFSGAEAAEVSLLTEWGNTVNYDLH